MRFLSRMFFFGLLIICSGFSQSQHVDNFNFDFDYAAFRGADDYIYLEMYFSIARDCLQYVENESSYVAQFNIHVNAFQNDSLIANRKWGALNQVDSLTDIGNNQKLMSLNYISLKAGEYRIKVNMIDVNSGREISKEGIVSLTDFQEQELCMSDIEFASKIEPSKVKNQYYKNGYSVVPNTERFYGIGLPILMFYTEIYNLVNNGSEDTSKYSVKYSILNSDELPYREFPERIKKKPGVSAVEVGGLNIITFTSGTYFLKIDITDLSNNAMTTKQEKFFVYRPGDFEKIQRNDSLKQTQIAERSLSLMKNIYGSMTEEEIDNEFAATTYIGTNEEKNIYKTLDLPGKREFMAQFWNRRDESTNTVRNEFREDYIRRIELAEREFRGFRKGWKSDEGRVLLLYGKPDEIERFPSSNDNKAYRIWRYFSVQGGVDFIFVDKRGWGEYELVHSTARGELYDQEWQRWISPN